MHQEASDLGSINRLVESQEHTVRELEERLFLEQLRLASLRSTMQRVLRCSMGSISNTEAENRCQ